MKILDFYKLVNCAGEMNEFLSKWRGDPRIRVKTVQKIIIAPEAFSKLEDIYSIAKKLKREVAFMGLIDEKKLEISAVSRYIVGEYGRCEWEKDLFEESIAAAKEKNLKVMLGHTHPAGYGAICSAVYGSCAGEFGEDYNEMRRWMTKNRGISRFHIIMSPFENQIGIFELKSKGVVIYYPWEVKRKGGR